MKSKKMRSKKMKSKKVKSKKVKSEKFRKGRIFILTYYLTSNLEFTVHKS
jgi:hypothetical protein